MRIQKMHRRHKRLQFLIVYLLRHGWIVKLHANGCLRFKQPGKRSIYLSSLRYQGNRRK
ncbi:MAG: hypothetical protein MESAZ_00386 [Saezia sanguinis]